MSEQPPWTITNSQVLGAIAQLSGKIDTLTVKVMEMSTTVSAELATILDGLAGISTDLTAIQAEITKLQAGNLSAADQATLDSIAANVAAVKATADAMVPTPP
jgi:hypothetical protein